MNQNTVAILLCFAIMFNLVVDTLIFIQRIRHRKYRKAAAAAVRDMHQRGVLQGATREEVNAIAMGLLL